MMVAAALPTVNNTIKSPSAVRSPTRNRSRRWRQSRITTAIVAVLSLVVATSAWLSLVFSNTSACCWHHLRRWEATPVPSPPPFRPLSATPPPPSDAAAASSSSDELSLRHIVFGIAGSAQLFNHRKDFLRLWWRPGAAMRGHVWLEESVERPLDGDGDGDLPPIRVSEDISRFRYTNPTGHPSGLRISRIVAECFRLGLAGVRWFVLGDDDTIFNVENLVGVLKKYDHREMVYIGSPSESHSANTYFSHSMAFGGGGIAISYPLAEALSRTLDECLERYPKLYGSDDRLHACISELGVPLTRELGFHQVVPFNFDFGCNTTFQFYVIVVISIALELVIL